MFDSVGAREQIYMDNNSTTRVDPRVLEKMLPYFTDEYGNAASTSHVYGRRAAAACELARSEVAALAGCDSREIIFTSGATESNNLAIKGLAAMSHSRGNHLITAATEHHAVLDPIQRLGREGFEVTVLNVDSAGRVNLDELKDAIRPETILVSLMLANNEIGTLLDLAEVLRILGSDGIPLHTDAAQALGKIPIDLSDCGVALASFSGHKLYAPKGIGGLYVRRRPATRIKPLLDGGGHERNIRSGTIPVPLIVGFGEACSIARLELESESQRLLDLRERLCAGLSQITGTQVNGHPTERLPGNLNMSFGGVDGEALIINIGQVALSSGSACTSAVPEPSYVLRAIGCSDDLARASVRFGIGRFNTQREIDRTIEAFRESVGRLREMNPMWQDVSGNGN